MVHIDTDTEGNVATTDSYSEMIKEMLHRVTRAQLMLL